MAAPGKKYLLLKVPEHQPATLPADPPAPSDDDPHATISSVHGTFLRMGAADPNPPMANILNAIQEGGFLDDDRDRGTNATLSTHGNVAGKAGAGGPGHCLTPEQRVEETSKLLTKGGWHDHTDGNRISTTYGDKVEVIRGNYKQVVLGRQDLLDNAAGVDSSGGLEVGGDLAPGSISEIKWIQDPYSGTWKVTELTEKGDTVEIYHGSKREEFYGESIDSIIGSADEGTLGGSQLDEYTTKKTNPAITERTWASSIKSYTGSDGKHVPTVYEEVYADSIETHLYGKAEVKEYVGKVGKGVAFVLEETHCDNFVSHQFTGANTELQISFVNTGLLMTGVHVDIEIAALRFEIKAGGAFFELEAGALYTEVFIGQKIEIFAGRKFEVDDTAFQAALNTWKAASATNQVAGTFRTLALKWSAASFKASVGIGD